MVQGNGGSIFEDVRRQNRRVLTEDEAYELCASYGMRVPRFRVAKSPEEAVEAARSIGYPVVLKVLSPQVMHKTDVGGVVVGLMNDDGVRSAYEGILGSVRSLRPDARISGILVESQAPPSVEVIVGVTEDRKFGKVLMFGLGGIFAELMEDVSFRLIPVDEDDAREMMSEVRGYDVLKGFRGRPPLDVDSIVDLLLSTSRMVVENPQISQMDLNPVIVYEKGYVVVDCKVLLG